MRRRISLYIADHLVDLTDDSFILFNYTMEDMTDPTIVKNSFSQQISIKGTKGNNKLFGHIWKADRQTQYGAYQEGIYFDPATRTPFTIYNEMGEILEKGYCKLDSISRRGADIEYKVSLYGGLGAFFYALSYDSLGNRRTLADLLFTGSSATDDELDFTINATSVKNAWKRIGGDTSVSDLWDILNFAPAYNGLPGGTFDADKALVKASNAGIDIPAGYSTWNGYVLATFPNAHTEWEAKDLRTYLQRPVVRMRKVIDAICQDYNNGGYTVDLDSDFFTASNPYYNDTWLTLPLINTIDVEITEGGGALTPAMGQINLTGGGNPSTLYRVNITLLPTITPYVTIESGLFLYLNCSTPTNANYLNWITYTLRAYDSNGNLLETRSVNVSTDNPTPNSIIPQIDYVGRFNDQGVWQGDPISFSIESQGISYVILSRSEDGVSWGYSPQTAVSAMCWTDRNDYDSYKYIHTFAQTFPSGGSSYSYTTSDSARSGATITKKMLLSSDRTPADYLLSFCKMFGLVFLCDKATKKVTIMTRQNFYRNSIIDLTKRVNLREGITFLPYAFDSKWYNFGQDYSNGEYAQYYANLYDSVFGIQRVNTGYDFNAESRDLLEGNVFKGACEVLENSKYFVDIVDGSVKLPSLFLDSGGSYSLTDATGKSEDFSLPLPTASSVKTWWNATNKTFDFLSKVQFHNADNAGWEERDTLLFFQGMKSLTGITERIALTDDNAFMMGLNDNTPCWILDYQLVDVNAKVTSLPVFSRYRWSSSAITKSLDFGTPQEVAIPDVTFDDDSDIYDQYWRAYIGDRYDDDSRVMTCKVNLQGWQVNEDLLRNFYFFDGCVWALNRIINHSLSTWDDTECEFIKVQDKSDYLD